VELDASNNLVSHFVYGTRSNVPDLIVRGGATYRVVTDQLGTAKFVLKVSDGSVAQQLNYDESGNNTYTIDNTPNVRFQPFGFAGGLDDPISGLTRFGARDYDPSTGRWTVKDPIQFAGGLNLYAYSENDPVNISDPSGRNPAIIILGAIALILEFGGVLASDDAVMQVKANPELANDPVKGSVESLMMLVPLSGASALTCGGAGANVMYHYTDAPESKFRGGLWSGSSVTNTPHLTADEAVKFLGLKSPPDKIIPVVDNGHFIPNSPPVVQPHRNGPGGGLDFTNPRLVPASDIQPAIPVRQ
jgi:RHS repeat-associated protein